MKTELYSCYTSLKADPTFIRQKHSKEWTQPDGILCEGIRTGRNWFLVDNAVEIGVLSPHNIMHFAVIACKSQKWMKRVQEADFPNQQFLCAPRKGVNSYIESPKQWRIRSQVSLAGSGWHTLYVVVANWLQYAGAWFSHL